MKKVIQIKKLAGEFAENKDVAKDLRVNQIIPTLSEHNSIVLDFSGISGTTQSFIHALISEPIRQFGDDALDMMEFKNCSDVVREVVRTVCEYMQESIN